VVEPDGELDFLHPLPVERLWGVGPVTAGKLHERGITWVREVALLPEDALVAMLGPASGRHLHALAHNRDPRRVQVGRRRRSMGSQRALGRRSSRTPAELDATLLAIVDRLGRRLRAARRVCRTVTLRLRFDDFSRVTRSYTFRESTAHTQVILGVSRDLLDGAMPMIRQRGVTLVGITLSNLDDDSAIQLVLPFGRRSSIALDRALDVARDRFGTDAVTRAVLLGRDHGPAVPLLPD